MSRSKVFTLLAVLLLILGAYPGFVLGFTWFHVARSDLPGGRNGPLDAYRHTLASAVVAYTLDERVVYLVSRLMERDNILSHRMDRHNNFIGARIGSRARHFRDLEPTVARQVARGRIYARGRDQTTWMHRSRWERGKFW